LLAAYIIVLVMHGHTNIKLLFSVYLKTSLCDERNYLTAGSFWNARIVI